MQPAFSASDNNNDFSSFQGKIIVIGAGLAGLFTALKLSPLPVTVISPASLGEGASSFWAQGGIAAAIGEGDTPEKHVQDTISVGGGIVDEMIASLVAQEASERIEDLLSYGVPFDKDLAGKLKLSQEAAHSERRIVRVKGDMAGRAIMECLITTVRNTPSINILEGYRVIDLSAHDNKVSGVYISPFDNAENTYLITAPAVVMASGGVGGLYSITTNPSTSVGEGMALAAKAGAVIADPEFVQFHPTAINVGEDPAPLATEALRGDGAILVTQKDERFMLQEHQDAELAPRDIVARAVHKNIQNNNGAFLDCTKAIGDDFQERFPTVYEKCLQSGIDPVSEPIPVAPAAHYHMGGIYTDKNGRTTIEGLWACGEAASTGMHGANRLASNSLLEAVVFAARIAEDIRQCDINKSALAPVSVDTCSPTSSNEKDTFQKLRRQMSKHLGVIRSEKGMSELLDMILQYKQHNNSLHFDNVLISAQLMTQAALLRKESRGGHFRSDYPEKNSHFSERTFVKLSSTGEIKQIASPQNTPNTQIRSCK